MSDALKIIGLLSQWNLKKKKTETGLGSKKENSSVDTEREKFTGGIEVLKKQRKAVLAEMYFYRQTNKTNLEKKKVLKDTDNQYEMHTRSTMDNMVVS